MPKARSSANDRANPMAKANDNPTTLSLDSEPERLTLVDVDASLLFNEEDELLLTE